MTSPIKTKTQPESFAQRVAARACPIFLKVQAVVDSLHIGDTTGFYSGVHSVLDDPDFDRAFNEVCRLFPEFAETARCEVMRNAGVTYSPGSSGNIERVSDLFFLPVTGTTVEIADLISDQGRMARLESSLKLSGLASPDATIALARVALEPVDVASASPGVVRRVNRRFASSINADTAEDSRKILEETVMSLQASGAGTDNGIWATGGRKTVLFCGYYSRDYDFTRVVDIDAMAGQISGDEEDEYDDHGHAATVDGFVQRAAWATGLEVGTPQWLGRGCVHSAIMTLRHRMRDEAHVYGYDLDESGLEKIAFTRRGGDFVIEGEVGGVPLGPFSFPASIFAYDWDWTAARLEGMAAEVRPPWILETGRSLSLN